MEKVYAMKYKADEIIRDCGHEMGYYRREFHLTEKGEVSRVLVNECVKCGAEVVLVSIPFKCKGERYTKKMSGKAVEDFCPKGTIPVQEYKNIFAPNDREEYMKKNSDKLAKMLKSHGM